MTISEAAARHNVCTGGCGLGEANHRKGVLDPWGGVHFANRRFTRRALRNMLLLVARRDREANPEYLNVSGYDWYYLWDDNVRASRMAMDLGVRLPARLSRLDRLRCLQSARRRGVRLSRRGALSAWAHDV